MNEYNQPTLSIRFPICFSSEFIFNSVCSKTLNDNYSSDMMCIVVVFPPFIRFTVSIMST